MHDETHDVTITIALVDGAEGLREHRSRSGANTLAVAQRRL